MGGVWIVLGQKVLASPEICQMVVAVEIKFFKHSIFYKHTKIMHNDDALIDCIVYANEVRMGTSPEGILSQRQIIDPPPPDKECSISMCGNDGDPSCQLLRYCPNGHCIHDKCVDYMYRESESLSTVVCPQCRSDSVMDAVVDAVPIPFRIFTEFWSDKAVAADAVRYFAPEIGGISMLPLLMMKERQRANS